MRTYLPHDQHLYFAKAIKIQYQAFKEDYAKQKFEQSCETLIRCGFCSSTRRDCDKRCALKSAHDDTLKKLKDPDEVNRRYKAYVARTKAEEEYSPPGVERSVGKNGRVTLVLIIDRKD